MKLFRSRLADAVGVSCSMWSLAMSDASPLAWICALTALLPRTTSMLPSRMSLTIDPPARWTVLRSVS